MTRTRGTLTRRDKERQLPAWEPEPLVLPLYIPEAQRPPALEEGRERETRVVVIDLC